MAETALALAAFRSDPAGLVTACRRVISRQVSSGGVWWLCSRVLCATEPMAEASSAVGEIEADRTARHLAVALPEGATVTALGWQPVVVDALSRRGDLDVLVVDCLGEGASLCRHLESRDVECVDVPLVGLGAAVAAADVLVVELSACGPDQGLGVVGSLAALAVARQVGTETWGVAGVGRMLPARVWDALAGRLDADGEPWDASDDVVDLELFDWFIGADGPTSLDGLVRTTSCPVAPELLKPDIT